MRAARPLLALVVSSTTASTTVSAFSALLSRGPGCRTRPRSKNVLAATTVDRDLPLPPRDETFNPFAVVREILAAPDVVEDAGRYDRVGGSSGGIWRSLVIGFIPSTVVTFQQGSQWIIQQEAAGNVYQSWPSTVVQVLGEKALSNLSEQPKLHAIGRQPYSEALSPRAVLELRPSVEAVVRRKMQKLEELAEQGQEVCIQDELRDVALESIAGAFFCDYATPEFVGAIKRVLETLTSGLFSLPVRFPWPLNQIPIFGFGKSMEAREVFRSDIIKVLKERRTDLASAQEGSSGKEAKSAGVLDSLIKIQQEQQGIEGGQDGRFDDDFIIDNVILSLFAGTDTTSAMLTRILQLLATAEDGGEIVEKLLTELRNDATSDVVELDDTTETGSGVASRVGILEAFPLLDAVILETFRLHPTIPAVFRKTRVDVNYKGFLVPAGKTINWNIIHGLRAASLYPEPKKFCPFRFFHGDERNEGTDATPGGTFAPQPPPPMFGLGRHMCPGRELAKLEMLLFLKEFLTTFDYELVKGQSFKGVLPANGPKDKLRVVLKLKPVA